MLFPPSRDVAGPWSKQLATPSGRQRQVVLTVVELSKVMMKDEECVELRAYGVGVAVFSEGLLDAISFVDGRACCPLLVAPSNRYKVAINLQMLWQ